MERTESHDLTGLPPSFLEALGRVAAHYGQIEHLLMVMIRRTAKLDWEVVFGMVHELWRMPDRRKRVAEFFARWVDEKFPGEESSTRKRKLDALLQNIAALEEQRHTVIHASWGVNADGKLLATRHGLPLVRESDKAPVGESDIVALGDSLARALWLLNQAVDPPPSLYSPMVETSGLQTVSAYRPLEVTATGASFQFGERHSVFPTAQLVWPAVNRP